MERVFEGRLDRRQFLKLGGMAAGAIILSPKLLLEPQPDPPPQNPSLPDFGDVQENPTSCEETDVWEGEATYYTRAGCVGCNSKRIMANGDPLVDTDQIIAFNNLPLNTEVEVTNIDTGLSIRARVTDRGGFGRYGYIADLSLGTRNAIGGSDITRVKISRLACR